MSRIPSSSSKISPEHSNTSQSPSKSIDPSSSAVPIAVPFPASPRPSSTSRRSARSTSTYSTSSQQARSNPPWRKLSFSKPREAQSSVSLVVAAPQLDITGERQSELALTNASLPSSSSGKGSFKRSRIPSTFLKRKPSKLEDMFEERSEGVEAQGNSEESTSANGTAVIANDSTQAAMDNGPIVTAEVPLTTSPEATTEAIDSTSTPHQIPDLPSSSQPEGPSKVDVDATPKSSTASTSWFASFGRSKGQEATSSNVLPTTEIIDNSAPEAQPEEISSTPKAEPSAPVMAAAGSSAVEPVASTSSNTPQPPTTIPIPSSNMNRKRSASSTPPAPRAKRSWFTSASPSSPSPLHTTIIPSDSSDDDSDAQEAPVPRRRETVLSGISTSSFPSSIDEERVPSLARTPDKGSDEEEEYKPPVTYGPKPDAQGTVRARMNSLNPSSSRFSISLPLLGRQKVKLDDVVRKEDGASVFIRLMYRADVLCTPQDGSSTATNDELKGDAMNVDPVPKPDAPTAEADVFTKSNTSDTSITSSSTVVPDSSTEITTTTDATTPSTSHTDTSRPEAPPGTSTIQWEGITPPNTSSSNITDAATARYSWWDYVAWGSSGATGASSSAEKPAQVEEIARVTEAPAQAGESGKVEEPAKETVPKLQVTESEALKKDDDGDGKATIRSPSDKKNIPPSTSSGSWFGWGGGAAPTTDKADVQPSEAQAEPQPQPPSSSTTTTAEPAPEAATTTLAAPPVLTPALSTDSQATVKVVPQPVSPTKAKKPASVFSSDTAGARSGSWFAPWSWNAPLTAAATSEGAGEGVDEPNSGEQTMTESEKIKEEALARQKELDEQHEREEREREEREREQREKEQREKEEMERREREASNPLDSAISSRYSSSWASFFGSVSKRSKMIKDHAEDEPVVKRDENGMEVMDLDLDEGEPGKVPVVAKSKDIERVKASSGGGGAPGGTSKPSSIKSAPAKQTSTEEKALAPEIADTKGKQKAKSPAPTITVSDDVRRDGQSLLSTGSPNSKKKKLSPTPSVKSAPPPVTASSPTKKSGPPNPPTPTRPPNLVLPTWADTFHTPPRSIVPMKHDERGGDGMIRRLGGRVGKWFMGTDGKPQRPSGSSRRSSSVSVTQTHTGRDSWAWEDWGKGLPRAFDVLEGRGPPFEEPPLLKKLAGNAGEKMSHGIAGMGAGGEGKEGKDAEGHVRDVLKGCKNVVVIGIHGWFPGAMMRTVFGEPTGTSAKFVNMMVQALEEFQEVHGVKLEKVTKIPLEGEGTIDRRVEKLYNNLLSNQEWMSDLHNADAIFVATHSQGSVVSTHLLDRLIRDRHIRTSKNAAGTEGLADLGINMIPMKPQKVCCLALCGIHLGPLRYLSSSALVQPYLQYFESAAARELFDFQDTESEVSKSYVKALENVVNNGTKMVYVASLDDQVVPIYSGLFTSASHPLILRALYIDGDAYTSSDFLSNLLVLLLRVLNCGLSDSGLLAHLSDVTAGTLSGVGHSTAYEELSNYALAVNYLFLTNDGLDLHPELRVEPFNATAEQNDYEIPWALRDLIADERVAQLFGSEIAQLRDAFREWQPKTAVLKDIKRKLQPIQRLPSTFSSPSTIITTNTNTGSASKL
ncbi:hypothetical protein V5O48_001164 [Marasmius crinis-equi]|uniref:YMC020W-like alpha/beta hydrolase domain-containing protein n=1 Tax=Marasmius crinis-equi TaxID=585013 RepID=A0ABR3FZ93_9AGAR